MSIEIITKLQQMEELQKQGFIFRGHESSKYLLQPCAFRSDKLLEMEKYFGVNKSIIRNWYENPLIMKTIKSYYPTIELKIDNPECIIIDRLLNYCSYLIIYNYSLSSFSSEDLKISDKDASSIRDPRYWKSEETFFYLFSGFFSKNYSA